MKRLPRVLCIALVLSLFAPLASSGQDIRGFEIDRYEYFTQCTSNPAPLATARRHHLAAFVVGNYGGAITEGTLSRGTTTWVLTNKDNRIQNAIALSNPAAGPYVLTATTASQGVQRKTLSVPAKTTVPPRIANWTAAQGLEATQPFTLEWDNVRGVGARDYLVLRIFDSADELRFETQLDKTETSTVIPAGTLAPGTTNSAFLYVMHLASLQPSRNGRPYVAVADNRVTQFTMKTRRPEGQLRFASNQLCAFENAGVIDIPVVRSGTEGTVTVDFSAEDGSARAGVNYVATNGTLTFPAGEATQTISIPLLDDGQSGAPLTGRIRLSNATGGVLLPTRPWVDWSILDNQTDPGQNVNAFLLCKVSFFNQTNENVGDQSTRCVTSRFFASVHPRFPGAIGTSGLYSRKTGVLALNMPAGSLYEYNIDFPTRALMDKQFRSGAYIFDAPTLTQESVNATLLMTPEPQFPVPHLSNWSEAQAIDASLPFSLHWDSFQNATSNDYVRVAIFEDGGPLVMETGESFEPGALPASATSFEIPANTLRPGRRYFVNLILQKATRVTIDPTSGAKCGTLFAHTTVTDVHTQPTSPLLRPALVQRSTAGPCCSLDGFSAAEPGIEPFDLAK